MQMVNGLFSHAISKKALAKSQNIMELNWRRMPNHISKLMKLQFNIFMFDYARSCDVQSNSL